MKKSQQTTLITGVLSGIGKALAYEFAKKGHPLIIVADNKEKLETVADSIRTETSVPVHAIVKDMSDEAAPQALFDTVKEKGLDVDILINNGGIGFSSEEIEFAPLGKVIEIIRLDIEALAKLTRLFLPKMLSRDDGRILNVSSVAGYQPGPTTVVHHAARAYVQSLSESLIDELRKTGVTVTCLAPTLVDSFFFDRTNSSETVAQYPLRNEVDNIAQDAYEGLMRGENIVAPGIQTFSIFNRYEYAPVKIK